MGNEDPYLMDTSIAFPLLGRELHADSPDRTCLQVFTCVHDGSRWARWLDQPEDELRPIEMTPQTVRWVE